MRQESMPDTVLPAKWGCLPLGENERRIPNSVKRLPSRATHRPCPRSAILSRCLNLTIREGVCMLVEQQIAERRERARSAVAKILERPSGEIYGDYRVQSTSGKTYRVAMRGPGLFENYCS